MLDVGRRLSGGERLQIRKHGDALAKLHEVVLHERLRQLRLTGQNDLNQLRVGRLKIGQQADRFQHRLLQILRFVHDQHEPAPAQHFLEQGLVQRAMHGDRVHPRVVHFQFIQNVAEQFPGGALRLKQENDAR